MIMADPSSDGGLEIRCSSAETIHEMARQYRLDHEGALHHVMTRGVEKRSIFLDDADRADFARRLGRCVRETGMGIVAWALMPNHIHLLTRTHGTSLSRFMHRLLTGHAVRFNARNERVGPLFQGRYKAILVQEETYFARLVRYIHLNPVRAGLVSDIEELARFPWTGHAAILDPALYDWYDPREIDCCFSQGDDRTSGYLDYLMQPELLGDDAFDDGTYLIGPGGLVESASEAAGIAGRERHLPVLGDRAFSEALLLRIGVRRGNPLGRSRGWEHEVVSDSIAAVESALGLPRGYLRGGGRTRTRTTARELACYCLVEGIGLSLKDAAGVLGITRQGAFGALARFCSDLDRNIHYYNGIISLVSALVNAPG